MLNLIPLTSLMTFVHLMTFVYLSTTEGNGHHEKHLGDSLQKGNIWLPWFLPWLPSNIIYVGNRARQAMLTYARIKMLHF